MNENSITNWVKPFTLLCMDAPLSRNLSIHPKCPLSPLWQWEMFSVRNEALLCLPYEMSLLTSLFVLPSHSSFRPFPTYLSTLWECRWMKSKCMFAQRISVKVSNFDGALYHWKCRLVSWNFPRLCMSVWSIVTSCNVVFQKSTWTPLSRPSDCLDSKYNSHAWTVLQRIRTISDRSREYTWSRSRLKK